MFGKPLADCVGDRLFALHTFWEICGFWVIPLFMVDVEVSHDWGVIV